MNTINTSIDSDYMHIGATGSLGTIPAPHTPAGRRHPCLLPGIYQIINNAD